MLSLSLLYSTFQIQDTPFPDQNQCNNHIFHCSAKHHVHTETSQSFAYHYTSPMDRLHTIPLMQKRHSKRTKKPSFHSLPPRNLQHNTKPSRNHYRDNRAAASPNTIKTAEGAASLPERGGGEEEESVLGDLPSLILLSTLGDLPGFVLLSWLTLGNLPGLVLLSALGDLPSLVLLSWLTLGDFPSLVLLGRVTLGDLPGLVLLSWLTLGDLPSLILLSALGDLPGFVLLSWLTLGDLPRLVLLGGVTLGNLPVQKSAQHHTSLVKDSHQASSCSAGSRLEIFQASSCSARLEIFQASSCSARLEIFHASSCSAGSRREIFLHTSQHNITRVLSRIVTKPRLAQRGRAWRSSRLHPVRRAWRSSRLRLAQYAWRSSRPRLAQHAWRSSCECCKCL
jgi:hypothetical protein